MDNGTPNIVKALVELCDFIYWLLHTDEVTTRAAVSEYITRTDDTYVMKKDVPVYRFHQD
jgi:hypothetical protein